MKRKKIVAGNWKMNCTHLEGVLLAQSLLTLLSESGSVDKEIIIAPPFTLIHPLAELLKWSNISIAGQNCSDEVKGAYTGEISAEMLLASGAGHVILGHSERRKYFNETDALVAKKTSLAIQTGLTPIYCLGETLEERNSGNYFDVIENQISTALFGMEKEEFEKVIIAYEPVWAIGTGMTATPDQAQEIHAFIRWKIHQKFGASSADKAIILYGGSCNGNNAAELFSMPDVDGGLIGGASLKAEEFIKIIEA